MVDQLVGITLSGCKIIKLLGKGGMGSVFLGRQVDLGRFVAVKILSKNLIQEEGFLRRFKREARSVASLSHPNIVQVYQYGEEDGIHFIVMEYIEGETLGGRLVEEGTLPEKEVLRIARQATVAIEEAQKKKIVHRDIKPDNIILSKQGEVKVTDFGLAKNLSGGQDQSLVTKQIIGTPAYISPEQIKGAPIDPRSDLYSLGATIYHAVAGKPPFTAKNPFELLEKHLKEKPVPPMEVKEGVSQGFNDVILKCLEKDPNDRYQTPEELLDDLKLLEAGEKPVGAVRAKGISIGLPVKLVIAAGMVAGMAYLGFRFFPGTFRGSSGGGATTGATGVDVTQLERERQFEEYRKNGKEAEEAGDLSSAITLYEEALKKKDDPSLSAQVTALRKKQEELAKQAVLEAERKERREEAHVKFSEVAAAGQARTAEQCDGAIELLQPYVDLYPDDVTTRNFLKQCLKWKEEILSPPVVPTGPTGPVETGPEPTGPEPTGPEPTGPTGPVEKPPFTWEGLPPPPFEGTIFLKNGDIIQTVILEFTEDEVVYEAYGGKGTTQKRLVERIEARREGPDRIDPEEAIRRAKEAAARRGKLKFAVEPTELPDGRLSIQYDFSGPTQKEDWTFSKQGASQNAMMRLASLSAGGWMEFNTDFRGEVEVVLQVRPRGAAKGWLQVGIYGHSIALCNTKDELVPEVADGWTLKQKREDPTGKDVKIEWPEGLTDPPLKADSVSFITIRRDKDQQVYLNVNYGADVLLSGKILSGLGKITLKAMGAEFDIKHVALTGEPWKP